MLRINEIVILIIGVQFLFEIQCVYIKVITRPYITHCTYTRPSVCLQRAH